MSRAVARAALSATSATSWSAGTTLSARIHALSSRKCDVPFSLTQRMQGQSLSGCFSPRLACVARHRGQYLGLMTDKTKSWRILLTASDDQPFHSLSDPQRKCFLDAQHANRPALATEAIAREMHMMSDESIFQCSPRSLQVRQGCTSRHRRRASRDR